LLVRDIDAGVVILPFTPCSNDYHRVLVVLLRFIRLLVQNAVHFYDAIG